VARDAKTYRQDRHAYLAYLDKRIKELGPGLVNVKQAKREWFTR
jgi:hypothetical protein